MKLNRCPVPVLLAVAAVCVVAQSAGAVVHGDKVDAASVPWFVSVGGCGATLVAPDRLLTAAHCVAGRSPSRDLRGVAVGEALRRVVHVALHPGWRHRNGTENHLDDVALVQLDQPVDGVPLVTLAGSAAGPVGSDAQILGQGRAFAPGTGHSEAETLDSSLRSAPLRTISDAACARAFKGYTPAAGEKFDPRMRCSIDADGRAPLYSACNGDSGGPLWTGAPDAPVQLGIVSWGGDRCGADHLPSVFADVARYHDFITDPSPVWAPTRTGRARISGTPRAGRKLSCATPGYTLQAGAKLGYSWAIVGKGRGGYRRPKPVAGGRTHTVTKAERGYRLACIAQASNAGGFLNVGVDNRLIKR